MAPVTNPNAWRHSFRPGCFGLGLPGLMLVAHLAVLVWATGRLPERFVVAAGGGAVPVTVSSRLVAIASMGAALLLFALLALVLPRSIARLAESERDARFALGALVLTNLSLQTVGALIALDLAYLAANGQHLASLGGLLGAALLVGVIGVPVLFLLNPAY